MLKKLPMSILFSLISISLFACNEKDKNSVVSVSTSAVECDKYLTLVNELQASSSLPADPKGALEASIKHFKESLQSCPEATKRDCNSAYAALRAATR